MAAYFPETVDLTALPSLPAPVITYETGVLDQPTCAGEPAADFSICREQDPRYATAAQGRADVAGEVQRISKKVRDALVAVAGVKAGQS